MNATIGLAIMTALAAASAQAQSPLALEQIQQELARLSREVELLKAENAELRRHQGRAPAGSISQQDGPQTPSPAERLTALEHMASRAVWKGDFRYRHEMIDPEEAIDEQTRHRIRARMGVAVKVNDSVSGVLQIASNGGNNDPRSTTQTLTNAFDRKGLAIDLAYLDWKLVDELSLQLGKMPMPWTRASLYAWDPDLTPEGAALRFASGPFFGTAFGYWLSESSTASDSTLLGGQIGMKAVLGATNLTLAAGYFDVGAIKGKVTATPPGCARPFNTAFFGGAQGNTTVTVAGCPTLLNDFDMVEILAQADFKAGALPLSVFIEAIQNLAADDLDIGYAAGFNIGRAAEPHTWEIGYTYQMIEKDAAFGQFIDLDFGGGVTDTEGHALRSGYAPAKNWILSGTYFYNDRFVDVGIEREYKRLQLEATYKF